MQIKSLPNNSLTELLSNYYLSYSSYTILNRAVPYITDGLKPVQRRILHAMNYLDDGRYNKVANITGTTMAKFHPHGDSSLYGALISLGQKNLLIDTQGNWGNIYTGDNAAAGRYIEARLTKFAKEVVFNEDTTEFIPNYDGRTVEPISLPVKFPLLLALGTQGIANGYSTEILPHNAKELCESAIQYLNNKPYELLPDFQTGGIADIADYQNGKRGGKVKVRAKIKATDKNTVTITEIPYSTTTQSIVDSIIKAADKDKIKIKKVEDNTSENVEINVIAAPGTDLDTLISALYTFTDCEVTISPMCTVIKDNVISTCSVNEVFEYSIEHTKKLLEWELQNKIDKLSDQIWKLLCEMVFVSTKTYEKLTKDVKSYEDAMIIISDGLVQSFNKLKKGEYRFIPFIREVTVDDCKRLYDMPIRRLSSYELTDTSSKINNLIDEHGTTVSTKKDMNKVAIAWFKNILKKYSDNWNRKTSFGTFTKIEAAQVALTNIKLYADLEKGFIGTSMKSEKYMCDVSDIDDVLVICKSGTSMVTKVQSKVFVESDIIYVNRIMKTDTTVFTIVYKVNGVEKTMIKRFTYGGYTRDKKIPLLKDIEGAEIIYIHTGDESESLELTVELKPKPRMKFKTLKFNINEFSISGRSSLGVMFTKYPIESLK